MHFLPPANLVDAGYVPRIETLCNISMARLDGGPADGMRVIDVSMSGGLSFRVLPDRGFDIGFCWSHGMPVGWESALGETLPLPPGAEGMGWLEAFSGGLLVTCGPDNIGLPSVDGDERLGLHGSWSSLPARVVSLDRVVLADGNIELCLVAAMVQTNAAGRRIEITRTLRTPTNQSVLSVTDVLTNTGSSTEPIPMLYHVNIGAPLWSPGAVLNYLDEVKTVPRDDYAETKLALAAVAPDLEIDGQEYVFEQVMSGENLGVTVSNESVGLQLSLSWTQGSLPRFHQWIHPAVGTYALGLEPANASLAGRHVDRLAGSLPELQPGESQTLGVTLVVSALTK